MEVFYHLIWGFALGLGLGLLIQKLIELPACQDMLDTLADWWYYCWRLR